MSENPTAAVTPHDERRRVVVGVDGSDGAARALDWAAARAVRTGSLLEIHAAHSDQYEFVTRSEVQHAMASLAQEAADRAAKVAPGLMTTTVTHEGGAARALVEASKGAGLLVVGSRGLGGFAGLLLGSVGHACAMHAHCPVVIVRPPLSAADDLRGWPPRRILVGVDGSASSALALEWALKEAELTGASVEILTSWIWPKSYGWDLPLPSDLDLAADAETTLHQVADPAIGRHPTVTVSLKVVNGHPAPTLVDASKLADLLVVGNRGRGEVMGALLGSVGEHCVAHAACPVVVMRGPATV